MGLFRDGLLEGNARLRSSATAFKSGVLLEAGSLYRCKHTFLVRMQNAIRCYNRTFHVVVFWLFFSGFH